MKVGGGSKEKEEPGSRAMGQASYHSFCTCQKRRAMYVYFIVYRHQRGA